MNGPLARGWRALQAAGVLGFLVVTLCLCSPSLILMHPLHCAPQFGELPALVEQKVREGQQSTLDSELVQQRPQTETHKPPSKHSASIARASHGRRVAATELFQKNPQISLDA